jgi:hypothetical protein
LNQVWKILPGRNTIRACSLWWRCAWDIPRGARCNVIHDSWSPKIKSVLVR